MNGDLMDINTNEVIRPATLEEREESIGAAERDGGVGAIRVEIDGVERTCYVRD